MKRTLPKTSMKMHGHLKIASAHTLFLVSLIASLCAAPSPAHAQAAAETGVASAPAAPANRSAPVLLDLNIENGYFTPGAGGDKKRFDATIENVAKYLRVADPNLNIVLTPETGSIRIHNLKLRSADMRAVMEALGYATGGAVRATPLSSGPMNWTIMASKNRGQERTLEVFNVQGYIRHLTEKTQDSKERDLMVERALAEVEVLVLQTLRRLKGGSVAEDETPEFQFHRGTGLLIVTGSPRGIEVARKIVNALPGQPRPGTRELLDLSIPQAQ